ncbi:hypothetical protein DPO21_27335, partial [Salmonella enterica]|nr:hypothetical protein [Salmonella enterica]
QSIKLLVLLDCNFIKMISYLFQLQVCSFCQGSMWKLKTVQGVLHMLNIKQGTGRFILHG